MAIQVREQRVQATLPYCEFLGRVLFHLDLLTSVLLPLRMRSIGLTVARRYRRETPGQKQPRNVIDLIPSRIAPFVVRNCGAKGKELRARAKGKEQRGKHKEKRGRAVANCG